MGYTARTGDVTTRLVEPLGLAAKAGTWYLIADTAAGLRTFHVDRIDHVDETGHETPPSPTASISPRPGA